MHDCLQCKLYETCECKDKQQEKDPFLPKNLEMPFVAYGLFQPGQLGFLRIKDLVEEASEFMIPGRLYIRDGIPLLKRDEPDKVSGHILRFRTGCSQDGYNQISAIEPNKQYLWETINIENGGRANILVGRSPESGSLPLEDSQTWDGQDDPAFKEALIIIDSVIEKCKTGRENLMKDIKPFFQAQMAYLLLWSSIERYATLRYGLGSDGIIQRIKKVAEEPSFGEALKEQVHDPRKIYRSDNIKKLPLDPLNPIHSIQYYYQVRSNITHRGKAAYHDFDAVFNSLSELSAIFKHVKDRAFEEAKLQAKCE